MAGSDLRAKIRIEADAKQATAEIIELAKAQKELATGAAEVGRAAGTIAPQIDAVGTASTSAAAAIIAQANAAEDLGSAVGIVRAAINPMVAELAAIEQTMRDFATAEDMGAISSREAALAIDQLAREANRIIGTMEAAGISIDGTTASMARQDTAAQQLINATTGITGATGATVAEQLRHGMAMDDLRARYSPLFAASRQYEIELRNIAEAERLGAISAAEATAARDRAAAALAPIPNQLRQVGSATQSATHYAGQLTYQLNDIGVMMSAGQNPFMLMMQQGPQVSQVLNDMRTRGLALGPAIAGAFTQMLNPVSLVTMGVIGFGSLAVQWFMSASEEAVELGDAVSDLSSSVSSYESAVKLALTPMADLRKEWGDQASAVREVYDAMADLERLKAMTALDSAVSSINDALDGVESKLAWITSVEDTIAAGGMDGLQEAAAKELLQGLQDELTKSFGLTVDQARRVKTAIDDLATSKGPDEAADAIGRLRQEFTAVQAEGGKLPPEMIAAAEAIYDAELQARKLAGPLSEAGVSAQQLSSVNMSAGIADAAGQAALLASNLGISLGLAQQIAGGFSPAPATATARVGFSGAGVGDVIPGGGATGGLSFGANPGRTRTRTSVPASGSGRTAASSGGGGSRADEVSEIAKIIAREKEELAVLRETDPVKGEMLRYSEEMAKATPAQRTELERLIRQQVEERETLQGIRDATDEIGASGKSAFSGLISGATGFSGALAGVLDKLAEMTASSAWDLLWGSGTGGLGLGDMFGGFLSSITGIPENADGGRIGGSGGPREDNILSWTSVGEYVVNAAATAANLPIIEAINAGAKPQQLLAMLLGRGPQALALGGMVGASAPSGWFSGGSSAGSIGGGTSSAGRDGRLRVEFVPVVDTSGNLTSHIRSVSRQQAEDVVVEGLSSFSAEVLPSRVSEINDNPRLKGR